MDNNYTIGDRLKHFAKSKYGSLAALARAMGIQSQSLTPYVNNLTTPGTVTQNKLRDLGCDIEWLMTGKPSVLGQNDTLTSNATDFVKLLEEKDTLIYRLTNEVKMLREEVDEYRQKIAPLPR